MRWILCIFIFISIPALSQEQRCKWVSDFNVAIEPDTLSIVPGSFSLSTPAGVDYDINSNSLIISPSGSVDSLKVCYTVFPVLLNRTVKRNSVEINSIEQPDPTIQAENSKKFDNRFMKSGILSRGINMGNRQDMSVDSRMDLRLEGDITDDLKLSAHIFDQNIPYQPDGNTNSLKNFDRLHLNIYNDKLSIEAGDIRPENRDYTFLKYSRGLMGAGIELNDSSQYISLKSGINKGRFHSYSFNGEEGINGPYRISGPVNEPFVIILAGSETVFVDGQPVRRGDQYEIDYNLGEVTFLPNVVITAFTRIRIDFEFMNRSFQRSAQALDYAVERKNFRLYAGYFSEGDNINFQNAFSSEEIAQLSVSQDGMVDVDNFLPVPYDSSSLTYVLIDTMEYQSVLRYSRDPTQQHYKASFHYVGEGKGNYIKEFKEYNSPVFIWVAPSEGNPQGNYEPVKSIQAPMRRKIFTTGAEIKVSRFESIFTELAYSDLDNNILNQGNSEGGIALKGGIKTMGRSISFLPDYQLKAESGMEWIDRNFAMADPYRSVDFNRSWGMLPIAEAADEWYLKNLLEVKNEKGEGLSWTGGIRNRSEQLMGWNSDLRIKSINEVIQFDLGSYQMRSSNLGTSNSWNSYFADLSLPLKHFRPGYRYQSEKNLVAEESTGSIVSSLQFYDSHKWYVVSENEEKGKYSFSYALRSDRDPVSDQLFRSETISAGINKSFKPGNLNMLVNHRKLSDDVEEISQTMMGMINGSLSFLKRSIQSNFLVSTQSGWEPKREFVYLQVPSGQGHYTWRDLNGDGIQQMNEFFDAINVDEQNYVRYFINSQERISANDNRAELFIKMKAPDRINSDFLKKFSATARYDLNGKNTESGFTERASSVFSGLDRDDVLSGRRRIRYRVFARDIFGKMNINGGFRRFERKQWVQNGFESRSTRQWDGNSEIRFNPSLSIRLLNSKEWSVNNSDVLGGRDYSFVKSVYGSTIEVRPGAKFKIETSYSYKSSDGGSSEEDVNSEMHLMRLEFRWKPGEKQTIQVQSDFASIRYEGNPNSAIAYDLMEAFHPGNNLRFTGILQHELNSGLMIHLIYNGRNSFSGKWINRASLRLSARF